MNNTTLLADLEEKFAAELLSRKTIIVVFEAGLFLIIEFVALVGNAFICVAMKRNKELRKRLTNIFIVSLALSDILMAAFCMPISLGILLTGKWIYKPFACDFQAYWIYVLAGISLYTMAVTAVNRYYRVVKPRKYHKYFTRRSTFLMVFVVWLTISLLIGLLVKISWLRVKYQSSKAACVMYAWLGSKALTSLYQLIAFVLFFLVPASLITFCYKKVFNKVNEHKRNTALTIRQNTLRKKTVFHRRGALTGRQSVEEVDMTKTLFTVVLGFALCWTPVIIYEFVVISSNMFNFYELLPRQIHLIWLYFPTLGSAANAFIYGAMNGAFRKEFKKLFWCLVDYEKNATQQATTVQTITVQVQSSTKCNDSTPS